jgi:hypothetical protein
MQASLSGLDHATKLDAASSLSKGISTLMIRHMIAAGFYIIFFFMYNFL